MRAYRRTQDEPQEHDRDTLVDLLTDLRHYCDADGLIFVELDAAASLHHSIEVEDD